MSVDTLLNCISEFLRIYVFNYLFNFKLAFKLCFYKKLFVKFGKGSFLKGSPTIAFIILSTYRHN